jgi:hypothetical protein
MTPPTKLDDEGHAVQRFIERYPNLCFGPYTTITFEDAERLLNKHRKLSEFVENIDNGQELWNGDGVLMVVKDGVVRTVLASWDSNKRRRT